LALESLLLFFQLAGLVALLYDLLNLIEHLALVTGLEPLECLCLKLLLLYLQDIIGLVPVLEVFSLFVLLINLGLDFSCPSCSFNLLQNFISVDALILLFFFLFLRMLVEPSIVSFFPVVVLYLPLSSCESLLNLLDVLFS
jgi:hypothetical protein